MSDPCITCGGEVGEPSPELIAAKQKFGMPITPPKRCSKCVWSSLLAFAASPDEEPAEPSSEDRETK